MTFLKPERDQVVLRNLFVDEVEGKIEDIRFMDHKILLREAT